MPDARPFESLDDKTLKDHLESGHIAQESFDHEWNSRYVVQEPDAVEESTEKPVEELAGSEPSA